MQPAGTVLNSAVEITNVFDAYISGISEADETKSDGAIKTHWKILADELNSLPLQEQMQRYERLRRLVLENGIAYDLFDKPSARQPWSIDLIPLIISSSEWAVLEKGLIQRANLFDHIAKDLYGPQNLLKSGAIPPRLIFSDPAFLRACREQSQREHLINFFAADLIRDDRGQWRIIDVHAETPAGVGFALANRLLHGQIMGDVFRRCHAQRLASHFQQMQTELLQRIERDDPLIALLTPGPHHEDYFSHAYLSRYLGFQLVEGGDLRVIGSRVYMKTLEGLKPIDLMIRCVEAAKCDPLELDPDGFAGPSGLVQALRKNPGLLANFLGSSVVENRGLAPSLAGVCRGILGEELILHEVPRRWLGDMEARVFLFDHPERFVIRRCQEGTGRPGRADKGILLETLTPKELEALKFELEINGQFYVAEERTNCTTTPSWTKQGLRPRPFAVRFYVSTFEGQYRVMPGGLSMSLDGTPGVAMSAMDGHSRDVWVLSDKEVASQLSLMRPAAEVAQVLRVGKGLRSRIADNLFWLGRYTERADWVMRIMRSAINRADETALTAGDSGFRALSALLSKDKPHELSGGFPTNFKDIESAIQMLLIERERSFSIPSLTANMMRVGSIVRERLSLELWQTLQRFSHIGTPDREEISNGGAILDRINAGIITLASLNGLTAENMTRNYGWNFLDMGRRIERAYNLAELLLTLCGELKKDDDETSRLFFVLDVADSTITFRQRYLFAPILSLVLDLVLIDESNPRGIGFQLTKIMEHLAALPQASAHAPHNEEQRLILDILTRTRLAKVTALAQTDASGVRSDLQGLLTHIISELPKLSEAITRRYFNLTEDELRRVYTRFGRRL